MIDLYLSKCDLIARVHLYLIIPTHGFINKQKIENSRFVKTN